MENQNNSGGCTLRLYHNSLITDQLPKPRLLHKDTCTEAIPKQVAIHRDLFRLFCRFFSGFLQVFCRFFAGFFAGFFRHLLTPPLSVTSRLFHHRVEDCYRRKRAATFDIYGSAITVFITLS
jgi:hypothetical protein